jgi:hypothetical protein
MLTWCYYVNGEFNIGELHGTFRILTIAGLNFATWAEQVSSWLVMYVTIVAGTTLQKCMYLPMSPWEDEISGAIYMSILHILSTS